MAGLNFYVKTGLAILGKYKADAARTKGSTGLGLSVAKELAGRMGGEISASVKDGIFIIRFSMSL